MIHPSPTTLPASTPVLETVACPHRQVASDGRIICRKVTAGDNEVSLLGCQDCPARLIGCEHLRFSLAQHRHPPIVVRYATGRTEVWREEDGRLTLARAACALRMALVETADCLACPVRQTAAASSKPPACSSARVVSFPRPALAAG